MKKIAKTLCLLAVAGLWQGCSSSSDDGDGGKKDGAADGGAGDTSGVFLSRGMNFYKITAVTGVTDNCEVEASTFVDQVLPVNYDNATQTLGVGNPKGAPAAPSLGSGTIGVTGTLTRDNTTSDGTCTWHAVVTSDFTLTGGDIFTLDVSEMQSMFTAGCPAALITAGMCTTTYTATFEKTTPPADGGA